MDSESALAIKKAIYGLLKSILDGCSSDVVQSVMPNLNVLYLLRDMFKAPLSLLQHTELGRLSPDSIGIRATALDAFIVLSYMKDHSNAGEFQIAWKLLHSGRYRMWTKYCQALESKICTTEILLSGIPSRYHFAIPEICLYLRQFDLFRNRVKAEMDTISRENPIQKQLDFVKCINSLAIEMDHMNTMMLEPGAIGWIVSLVTEYQDYLDVAPYLLSSAYTCLLVLFYGYARDPYEEYTGSHDVLNALAGFAVLAAIFLLFKYFVLRVPVQFALQQKKLMREKRHGKQNLGLHHSLHGPGCAVPMPGTKPFEIPVGKDHFEAWKSSLCPPEAEWQDVAHFIVWDFTCWYYFALALISLFAASQNGKGKFAISFIAIDYFRCPEGQVMLQSIYHGAPGLIGCAKVCASTLCWYICSLKCVVCRLGL